MGTKRNESQQCHTDHPQPDRELAGPVEHFSVFWEVRETNMSCKKNFVLSSHVIN